MGFAAARLDSFLNSASEWRRFAVDYVRCKRWMYMYMYMYMVKVPAVSASPNKRGAASGCCGILGIVQGTGVDGFRTTELTLC